MKRIWVLGASGHVGSALVKHMDCREYEIFPTDLSDVDVTREADVVDYARMNRPDVVINCAGYTDAELCEANPEMAYRVNAIGARNVAVAADKIGAKLVQMSTDDVFSGLAQVPYTEFDPVHPRSVYGKSKLAGEGFVTTMVNRYLIIRSSWVYGIGRDFVDYVLSNVGKQAELAIPNNQYAAPTSAKELARVMLNLVEGDEYGTYHVVCQGFCSRYEFAKEILRLTGQEDQIVLKPVIIEKDRHPTYSVLDNMMLRITGMQVPMKWEEALAEHLADRKGAK